MRRASTVALALAFAGLFAVGVLGDSAAKPSLGARGWAPGELPWALDPAATTTVLATAYVLGALGLVLRLRDPRSVPILIVGALAAGALLTQPFGSADHTNYAAYGRIALQGGDPWVEPPISWAGGADPVTSGVEPPWQATPSIYGPVATILQVGANALGGDTLRQVIWVWQLLIVLAWLGARAILRRLFPGAHGRIDTLWTVNPLVFGTAVLGAHVDLLATLCGLVALVLATGSHPLSAAAAGFAGGLGVGIKVTAGVVLLAVVAGWWVERRRSDRHVVGAVAALLAGSAVSILPAHLWAGPRVFAQLGESRRSISLASFWRKVYEWSGGHGSDATLRSLVFVAAAAVCVLLATAGWRVLRPGPGAPAGSAAVALTLALALAYAVAAPYTLPWYDQLVWALLPGIAALSTPAITAIQAGRALVMALAYVPGRVVGMTAEVETVTLAWRRDVAPFAQVAAAVMLAWLAVRVPRPAPPGPSSSRPRREAG